MKFLDHARISVILLNALRTSYYIVLISMVAAIDVLEIEVGDSILTPPPPPRMYRSPLSMESNYLNTHQSSRETLLGL